MQIVIAGASIALGLEDQKEEVLGSYQNLEAWRRSPQIWDPDLWGLATQLVLVPLRAGQIVLPVAPPESNQQVWSPALCEALLQTWENSRQMSNQ